MEEELDDDYGSCNNLAVSKLLHMDVHNDSKQLFLKRLTKLKIYYD